MRELKTASDVYETFGAMMRFIADASSSEPWLRQIDETWRFSISDPEAEVTCSFSAEGRFQVELGPSLLAADTTISLAAIDASAYLLGELNGFLEVDQGRVLIEGSPVAFLRTIPRMSGLLAQIYREVLQGDGADRQLLRAIGDRDRRP
jgi:hypothetical protein